MSKYLYMRGSELEDEEVDSSIRFSCWYKVIRHFDKIGSYFFYHVLAHYDCYTTENLKLDRIQYIRNKKREKIGVMIAVDGRVGWSLIHPKDRKESVINWDFSKAVAYSRMRDIAVTSSLLDIPKGKPEAISQFAMFINGYREYLKYKKESAQVHYEPCKFCGIRDALGMSKNDSERYAVKCNACGARGPLAISKVVAINLWNKVTTKPVDEKITKGNWVYIAQIGNNHFHICSSCRFPIKTLSGSIPIKEYPVCPECKTDMRF